MQHTRALFFLALLTVGCGQTPVSEAEDSMGSLSQEAARYTVSNTGALGLRGGGVYLANKPGYYYMGRLFDGQTFDRHGYEGNSSGNYTAGNGCLYRWGYAVGYVGACLWIGPPASGPCNEYLTNQNTAVSNRCPATGTGSPAWLETRENFGTAFNCPAHQATGPARTVTQGSVPAHFYYNLQWNDPYFTGGTPVDAVSTLIPVGTQVGYRYKTRDGTMAVVFHPTYGWGFMYADKVAVKTGSYVSTGNFYGRECACGDMSC